MTNTPDLTDKVAVITGGGGVLGSEMARTLAAAGARVAVLGRTHETLQAISGEIIANGGKALAITCDVLQKDQIEAAANDISSTWGPCDILINNAGGNHPSGTTSMDFLNPADMEESTDEGTITFFDLDPEGVRFTFDLNFLGAFLASQVFGRHMIGVENATIINISSMSGYLPLTQISAYSAAKAALSNFTQWLAVHLAKTRVRVNAIAPGFFVTKQNEHLLTREDGSPTDRGLRILSQTPQGRFGKPSDLNSTLLYLCDPVSEFVTGAIIPVDGGFSAYSGV